MSKYFFLAKDISQLGYTSIEHLLHDAEFVRDVYKTFDKQTHTEETIKHCLKNYAGVVGANFGIYNIHNNCSKRVLVAQLGIFKPEYMLHDKFTPPKSLHMKYLPYLAYDGSWNKED